MILFPINPFPSIKRYVDLNEYVDFINEWIDRLYNEYFKIFRCLDLQKIKDSFWTLVNDQKDYQPYIWYDFFSITLIRTLSFDILHKERRIGHESLQTHQQWFNYLINRVIPHQNFISDQFFRKLYSEYPIGNFEKSFQIIKEGVSIIDEYDLVELLDDNITNKDMKLRKFKESYKNYYDLFLTRCSYFGNEISKFEGNKRVGRWGDKINSIFYLKQNHSLRPPPLIEENLVLLNHIRNSLSHASYYILPSNKVKFEDREWSKEFKLSDLWKIFHRLILIDREFCTISLWMYALRWISHNNHLHCKPVLCHECNKISYHLLTPYTVFIICKYCQSLHFTKNLKLFDMGLSTRDFREIS